MPLPIVQARAPIDVAYAEAVEAALLAELKGLTLVQALAAYHRTMERILTGALGDTQVACAAGCSTCCHQPLIVSFLELTQLVLSDEARFLGAPFGREVKRSTDAVAARRKAGANTLLKVVQAQMADREPCVLLAADGRCSAYADRPFLCRNALSTVTCTFDAFEPGGFGDLGALARRLRELMHRTWRLDRFDTARIRTSNAGFFLPEGLAWVRNELDRKLLRRVFLEERPVV